jgi:hypothetical protein
VDGQVIQLAKEQMRAEKEKAKENAKERGKKEEK